jgi:hypothetical protein
MSPLHLQCRFLIRLLAVSVVILCLAKVFALNVVDFLVPAIKTEIAALDSNLSILDLALRKEGSANPALTLRANFKRPLRFAGQDFYPIGWNSRITGFYEVKLNATALLQSCVIFWIAILSWPWHSSAELARRLLFATPLLLLLFAIDKPLDLLGNFQQEIVVAAKLSRERPLFLWAKFLEAGGSATLALACAAASIALAQRRPPAAVSMPEAASSTC